MSTVHDREILNHIFNPLLPNGSLQFDENILQEGILGISSLIILYTNNYSLLMF